MGVGFRVQGLGGSVQGATAELPGAAAELPGALFSDPGQGHRILEMKAFLYCTRVVITLDP